MAILYDWNKILRASENKIKHIITIFDLITYKRKARGKNDIRNKFVGRDFSGNSFMLNPEALLTFKHCYTSKEIVQYIALCSYRNYANYQLTGDKTLSVIISPINTKKLTENRLLTIEHDKIHFLFEDLKKENLWL